MTRDGRIYTSHSLHRAANQYGIGSSFIKTELGRSMAEDVRFKDPTTRGFLSFLTLPFFALNDFYLEVANSCDNLFRVAMFMHKLDEGLSEVDAAKFTRNTYFDYADLTDLEKKLFRQVFLFYSYARKNQIQIFQALANNPSRVMAQLRLIKNSQQEYLEDDEQRGVIPDYLQTRLFSGGATAEFRTMEEYYAFEDLVGNKISFLPTLGAADATIFLGLLSPALSDNLTFIDGAQTIYDYLANQTAVIPKAVIEGLRGESAFNNKSLEKMTIRKSTVDILNNVHNIFAIEENDEGHIQLKKRIFDTQNRLYADKDSYQPASMEDAVNLYLLLLAMNSTPLSVFEGRGAKQTDFFIKLYEAISTGTNLGKEIEMPVGMTLGDAFRSMLGENTILLGSTEELKRQRLREQRQDSQ